ncbi:MAG: amino acid racemase [Candidatus Micrarchaeota archaeon]
MKTVGIIGGLGPETTAEFYLELIFGCYRKNKKVRPPILIWNVPIDYRIEETFIVHAKGEEKYLPYLIEAAKKLEHAGTDFLVMPCNSMHVFIDAIRASVGIPVLSIVEETSRFLHTNQIHRVGLLATEATVKHGLYKKVLDKQGISVAVPNGLDQARIGKLINHLVLKRGTNTDREKLMSVINDFGKQGVEDVILACTDLQLILPQHKKIRIYDTMKIFADATVDKMTS